MPAPIKIGLFILIHLLSSIMLSVSTSSDWIPDIKFPSPIEARSDGHLFGHQEPLGHQRPAIGQIPEYYDIPTPRELWDKHVKQYRPALLRGALNGSSALEKWSDQYLSTEYGEQEVLVEKKFEDRRSQPKRMMIKSFLEQYEKQNWYVVSMLPNVMRPDIKVPKPLICSTFRKNLVELNLWIGTRGTRSMLHYDADNILHCLVAGRKDWILINPEHMSMLDMVINREGQGSGFSHLNVDSIDETIHPEIWNVPWEYATLYGGDCLYLPPQYLHQVRSYNRSISSTFLFYPRDTFSDEDCEGVDLDVPLNLSDVYVYWTYEKDQETVDMGYLNPVAIREDFLLALDTAGLIKMNFRSFVYMTVILQDVSTIWKLQVLRKLFKAIDKNGDSIVTRDECESSDIEDWKEWSRENDSPHGPTKTFLNENRNASSEHPDFLPRPHNYLEDSKYTMIFLKFLLRAKGQDNQITFPEFKKWVEFEHATAADAFIIVDSDFDGTLTLEEVTNTHPKFLRDLHRLHFQLKGTIIDGGLRTIESLEQNNLTYLEDLNDIPKELFVGSDVEDKSESENITSEDFLKKLHDALNNHPKPMDMKAFEKFLVKAKISSLYEIKYFDSVTIFEFLDRGQKGHIALQDVEYYSAGDQNTEEESEIDLPVRRFEDDRAIPPHEFLDEIISVMDLVHNALMEMERHRRKLDEKEISVKEGNRKKKIASDEESDAEESDNKESEDDGESYVEEELPNWERDEL